MEVGLLLSGTTNPPRQTHKHSSVSITFKDMREKVSPRRHRKRDVFIFTAGINVRIQDYIWVNEPIIKKKIKIANASEKLSEKAKKINK